MKTPIFYNLFEIWSHLNFKRRIQIFSSLFLMLFSGAAELGSVATLAPFLTAIGDPDKLLDFPVLPFLAHLWNYSSVDELLVPTACIFVLLALLSSAVRLLNLWVNGRLAAAIGTDISHEAYRRTLYQPYECHLLRNNSVIIASIGNEITQVVAVINSCLQLVTAACVAACLMFGLFVINWKISALSIILFSAAYTALSLSVRRRLFVNSAVVADATQFQVKHLQETLGGIRDILLQGCQPIHEQIHAKNDRLMRVHNAQNIYLAAFPRYCIEALGIAFIVLSGLMISRDSNSSASVIPLLGTFALGFQRLLPALQQIYGNWVAVNARQAQIIKVLNLLNQPMIHSPTFQQASEPLGFRNSIQLRDLSFRYKSDSKWILDKINLEIFSGEAIGIIGATGAGKSTFVDIIIGLLLPTKGSLFVDGCDLHDSIACDRITAWRMSIAHVPQQIYLLDGTIAENIAFGVSPDCIDYAKVKQAAEKAQIAGYIESAKDGYATIVGENGIRLSGGQRQRIGIARALYRKANIIVLDEATSALDTSTEEKVIDSLMDNGGSMTIIMIAHRLSTLSRCDRIFELSAASRINTISPSLLFASDNRA